jgi:hypothetical protein
MPCVGVHRGDDPISGDAPNDEEHAVVALGDVLAGHDRHQVRGVAGRAGERLAVEHREDGQGVVHQRVDELFAGGGVVPIVRRFAGGGVLVVAFQPSAHPGRERRHRVVEHHQQLADGGPQLRDGVLGGHRVTQRRGVQHPGPARQHVRLSGHDP